ncbi:tellurium resistance protein TerC [Alisedimentitalea sp. MJ-SS2]|uniref:TerC family protein n=1 Tax=Aliisedimentitalea sp. MJ-SS2 TaxID=3049795 RepID=UPI00291126FD|nr:tellurium resistance protein TerC [Alisedimentitalea sp. MJ-SS2]MDU8927439.1 tellurium resistance protein TerC [Alisedimentitalea sp. MJ-SS2]
MFAELLTVENLGNLLMLCFLQAVLGFDNLLYISIESQRAPVAHQRSVRFWGIIIAVVLRVVLLFAMVNLIDALAEPFYVFDWEGVITGGVNFATVVFIFGGIFIIYTAVKEIAHMLTIDHLETDVQHKSGKSATQVVMLIVMMNLIFSFDSVLSAIAITDVFPVLALAILLSGAAMLLLADGVTAFLEKNRMYEVLGLFILLIVGVVLLGEAGQAAAHATHDKTMALHFFGYEVIPMSKTTFYFSVIVLFAVEILQSGYSRKLNAERHAHH